jgi:membrane protein DedA with SNARE-associated domain
MALAGTLGYLVGAIVGWVIGRRGGHDLVERHGRKLHLEPERFARAQVWFDGHGPWAVFLGRITPLVRSFVSIPAGVLGSPFPQYTVLTLAGSAIWCFAFAGAGWALGSSYEKLDHGFRYVDYAVIALVIIGVAVLLVRRRRAHSRNRAARGPTNR